MLNAVDAISRLPASIRAGAYFGLQSLIGSRIRSEWQRFQTWERFSAAELERAVDARLASLLDHAIARSSYYRNLGLPQRGTQPPRDFLRRLPVLSRNTVRDQFANIVIDSLRPEITSPESRSARRYDWIVVKTGGTTGTPTAVVHDRKGRDTGRAGRLFSQKLCGFPLGTPYFRLWGSEQDLLQQHEKIDRRVLRNLLGEIPLNAFRAKASELESHRAWMLRHPEVKHLMTYVDAAVSLAQFIRDEGREAPKFETIMACAGTVTPEWRRILSETFEAAVFDKYGSRECCDIACECAAHAGLHVYAPNVYVEVVDDVGAPCLPGVTGRILVTLLNNLSFPMIRYEIGDMGIWGEPSPCSCGLRFPRLASIEGRQDDMLVTEDGTLLSSAFVRHFIGVSLNRELIREWQFEQVAQGRFIFRYIPLNRAGLERNLAEIRRSFQEALGQSAQIQFDEVKEIPLSATGKVLWIVNRCRRNSPCCPREASITCDSK
jgi:phenylacetate-CoA ligase